MRLGHSVDGAMLTQIMAACDTHEDGHISYEAFIRYATQREREFKEKLRRDKEEAIEDAVRALRAVDEAKRSLNKYTTTLHGINSAIIKLSKLTRATKIYRGIAGMKLPDEFWTPNEFDVRGGIESAFMSTSSQPRPSASSGPSAPATSARSSRTAAARTPSAGPAPASSACRASGPTRRGTRRRPTARARSR